MVLQNYSRPFFTEKKCHPKKYFPLIPSKLRFQTILRRTNIKTFSALFHSIPFPSMSFRPTSQFLTEFLPQYRAPAIRSSTAFENLPKSVGPTLLPPYAHSPTCQKVKYKSASEVAHRIEKWKNRSSDSEK